MSKLSVLLGTAPRTIRNTRLAGLQYSVSTYGQPVPIVYGTTRIPGNLIDYDDFTAIPVKTKQRIGKQSVTNIDYRYTVMALYALCEGIIASISKVWADKDTGALGDFDLSAFTGSLAQSPWGYLTTNHPARAINYSGTAYVANAAFDLGGTGQLRNFTFEVQGLLSGGMVAGLDAQPHEILEDFLTNTRYGAGWNPAWLGDFEVGQSGTIDSSWQRYCRANGFFLSLAMTEQRPALEWMRDMLMATNAGAVFSEGVLKVFPFGDQAVTGDGVTYTPYTTPIYDLGPDQLIPPSPDADPVTVRRRPLADAFNTIPVEYLPRDTASASSEYNPSVVQDPDPADSDLYGMRLGATLQMPGITRLDHALQISRIAAQRSVYVRNVYRFRLPYRYILLDPMDLVTLTEPKLGLVARVVRIVSIVETESGELDFEAEEWPFGVATGTAYATEENDGATPNQAVSPGNSVAPVMFDIPLVSPEDGIINVGLVTSGGALWGGCQVWISYDDVTFQYLGTITAKGTFGELTSLLANGSGFDVVNDCDVDVTVSGGALSDVTDTEAQERANLSWVDGEFISFAEATLFDPFEYTLARIQRGIFAGSVGTAHASGSIFARCDDAMFRIPLPAGRLGSPIYVKLPAFNIWGAALQSVGSVSSHTFTPTEVFSPPGVGPTLVVTPTPGATSWNIAWMGTGTVLLSIDGGTPATPGASPITVNLTFVAQSYTFTAEQNGQTITSQVDIPPVVTALSDILVTRLDGSTFRVEWTAQGAPGGSSYTIDWEITADGSGSGSLNGATNPDDIAATLGSAPEGRVLVTLRSSTGQVLGQAEYDGPFIT